MGHLWDPHLTFMACPVDMPYVGMSKPKQTLIRMNINLMFRVGRTHFCIAVTLFRGI